MLLLACIISCAIAGSFACSDDQCKDPALANELLEANFLLSGKQLGSLCPKILSFLDCEKEYFECRDGTSLEELANSSDERKSGQVKALLNGISLARDLCDADSSFHQDYIESVDCFRGFISVAPRMCQQDIVEPIEKFFKELYPSEEDRVEYLAEIHCLRDAFVVACVVDNLGDSCGSVAQRTAITALERMKDAVAGNTCAGVENKADLKSRFLDFLELDDDRRARAQGIFDIFKRRR